MKKVELTINNPQGLISRKAAELVGAANRFKSNTILKTPSGDEADLKSIMNVFDTLINFGETLIIEIDGVDEDDAASAFEKLIANGMF